MGKLTVGLHFSFEQASSLCPSPASVMSYTRRTEEKSRFKQRWKQPWGGNGVCKHNLDPTFRALLQELGCYMHYRVTMGFMGGQTDYRSNQRQQSNRISPRLQVPGPSPAMAANCHWRDQRPNRTKDWNHPLPA